MTPDAFFSALWHQYIAVTPQAARIHAGLEARKETVLNDHVAFRTFSDSPIALANLEPHLLSMGYRPLEPYEFPGKHLLAWGYVPADERLPKVFLSELQVHQLPEDCQGTVQRLVAQIPEDSAATADVFYRGVLWHLPTSAEYERLAEVSEYASWLSVMGMRANHFTIAVHKLNSFADLAAINQFVKDDVQLPLNIAGGEIKGTPEVYLTQASTLADRTDITFSDGITLDVPTCFYEFAQRYPMADGQLYPGFVAASADRIFESTDR
ncbi:MAG: DUF1338 domain-containing protein [Natronospirillum sp.]